MASQKHILPSDEKRKRFLKAQAKSNENYGVAPQKRTVKDLLNNGIIILDKPNGPTSHQVDAWIRNILEVEKVGHGGTLDPNATGVLPVAIGSAAKSLQFLLTAGKEYVGIMKLHKDVDEKRISDVMKSFIGEIEQFPPIRSAVKRVRRKRRIYYLDVIQVKGRGVLFRVGCESGTYVRTLCVDAGKKLGCGANLAELRRTRVGHLKEEDSVILQDLKDAYEFFKKDGDEDVIRSVIHPIEKLFDHLPKIIIRDSAVDAICHGANLAVPGVVEVDSDIKKGKNAAIFTLKGEAVAIGNSLMSTEDIIQKDTGICTNIDRVVLKKGTYPSIWKKS